MAKPVVSERYKLNKLDLQKWGKNALIFFAPAILVGLTTYEMTGDPMAVWIAVKIWLLGTLTDLTRKFIAGNK